MLSILPSGMKVDAGQGSVSQSVACGSTAAGASFSKDSRRIIVYPQIIPHEKIFWYVM
jgi:hypothetical protein